MTNFILKSFEFRANSQFFDQCNMISFNEYPLNFQNTYVSFKL